MSNFKNGFNRKTENRTVIFRFLNRKTEKKKGSVRLPSSYNRLNKNPNKKTETEPFNRMLTPTMNNPNSLWTVTDCPRGFLKIPHLSSKIWDRSNDRSKPQTNPIINKTLKQSVTSSRIKLLSLRVC